MSDKAKNLISIAENIEAVPTILDVVCKTTGMGFAAVARVTEDRWIACNVRDEIQFGLKPGGELKIETTICDEIRQHREPVIINHVSEDKIYNHHHTPAMYGFQSYISMPIILPDKRFFGTLCAIDPNPHRLNTPEIIGMFKLFAELIAFHIDAGEQLQAERKNTELREQFIAVLSHDLRNPLGAIAAGSAILKQSAATPRESGIIGMIQDCTSRMFGLIENVLDFARGRLGEGIVLNKTDNKPLEPVLNQVIAELRSSHPDKPIEAHVELLEPVNCDSGRIAQLFSNLLGNALTYGTPGHSVKVKATSGNSNFQLSVTNAAEQIPPDTLQRLFQPFSRGKANKNQQGLGLGLYIASEIATAHGGRLEVTSTAEETCFTFTMPSGNIAALQAA